MKNKENVLILGGEGFIGRNIAEVLSGDMECFSAGNIESFFPERKDSFIGINPYKNGVDLSFDVCIHLIDNQVELSDFLEEEKSLMKNIAISKDKHLIVFSSAVVYANPESPYGRRKLALEDFYEKYCRDAGINLTIIRLFNIYGKYHLPYRQGSLIANMFFNHINKIPIEINDLEAKRDFIYAGDMARIIKFIIINKVYGKMDLATGKLISIEGILNGVRGKLGIDLKIIDKKNKEDIISPSGDNSLSKNINLVKMVDGLEKTYYFYKENNQLIKEKLKL